MRKFYQESWQGIPFSAFTHVSFFHLANAEFYATFYEELFRRFHCWDCLPAAWRMGKDRGARWIAEQISAQELYRKKEPINQEDVNAQLYPEHCTEEDISQEQDVKKTIPAKVLSIGSGVGYLEKSLLDIMPEIELHVNEPNTVGLRWLKEVVPMERIYIGSPSTCLPSDVQYHVIYLSAVDYSFTNEEFAFALREIKAQLAPGGRLLCLSSSLLEESSFVGRWVNVFKIGLRAILHFLGVRRQQFWGWRRTQAEYYQFFEDAGFRNIQDGWLDDGFNSYWISGE